MNECQWIKPMMFVEFEFAEWTPDERLRHAVFAGLRRDKKAKEMIRETC
jgi:bifunctional non-homologous end joining protein LigD